MLKTIKLLFFSLIIMSLIYNFRQYSQCFTASSSTQSSCMWLTILIVTIPQFKDTVESTLPFKRQL